MGKWTRRAFITAGVLAGGAVVFGVAIRPGDRRKKVAGAVLGEGESLLNLWLKISPDNTITAILPHSEMGQGVHTALSMMLADEMDADWSTIQFEEAPAHSEYANYILAEGFILGDAKIPSFLQGTVDGTFLTITKGMGLQITGGSASVRFTGEYGMRVAGASAKSMLLDAASETWNIPVSELKAKNSYIHHEASGKSAPFADFAQQAAQLSVPSEPKLKTQEEFTIMGTSPGRFDLPAKVDGTAQFGMDVQVPGMKYATIKAAPVFGAKIKSVDASAAKNKPGVHKIIEMEDAVAVVADGYWIAKQALATIQVEYEKSGHEGMSQADIKQQFANDLDAGDLEKDLKKGNVQKVAGKGEQVLESEYSVPYLAHATMEPMNCTAHVKDGSAEVWIGCQNPLGFAQEAAKFLDIDLEKVTFHNQLMGGGFGRRATPDVLKQALTIAKDVDYPVKLIWSREEDMQHDVYREANLSRFKAELDADGNPLSWSNSFANKHEPVEAPYIPYKVDNQLIQYTKSTTQIPWGPWRSVDHSLHGYFTESFMDELAHAAKKDPYEYRRELLAESPRIRKVLETAAEKAGWGETVPPNWGRGIAIHTSFGTTVAEVVDVEVDHDGKLKVHKVVVAADPGFAVHPDSFKAQIESGVIYGLTAAMYGEISIENGKVKQSNFHDYEMVRMNEAPEIEVHIINSGEALGGAGEPGTPAIAPALANAIFDATGKRVRDLPVKNHDLKREVIQKDIS